MIPMGFISIGFIFIIGIASGMALDNHIQIAGIASSIFISIQMVLSSICSSITNYFSISNGMYFMIIITFIVIFVTIVLIKREFHRSNYAIKLP